MYIRIGIITFRILKLQNPNHLYQEKLHNDANMDNWWQRMYGY